MRFILAEESFKFHGVSYAGFPIILDDEMRIVEPAYFFLFDVCIRNGRVESRASWERYGRDLYDFFGFVLTNGFDWRAKPQIGYPHVAETYRDWSLSVCKLARSTANHRLRTIRRFYQWAEKKKLIDDVPFEIIEVGVNKAPGFLAHVDARGGKQESSSLMLKEPITPLKFLTSTQCVTCLKATTNPTHKLMFRLAMQTGLRSEELRTFPEGYVFDPARRADLVTKAKVRAELNPADMKLKGNRARSIDMPIDLMEDLWQYSILHRPTRAKLAHEPRTALFLTKQGNPYSESAIERVFCTISGKVKFNVTPHMLRHAYASYTLHGLRGAGFKGNSLLYLRDRLGHTSVQTTEIYLHLLEQIDVDLMTKYEEEINALFRKG